MKKAETEKRAVVRFWRSVVMIGLLAIMIGVLALYLTMYYFDVDPVKREWSKPFGELLESLAVSAIVFGVFNLIIGLPDWGRYFERRLQKIVLEHSYLSSLSGEQLRDLHRQIIRAIFKSEDVDREGSFADYFNRHLHQHLGEPYRENARAIITYADDGDAHFFVHDFVSYVARENGRVIQDRVSWNNDAGELEEVYSIKVAIRFPDGHPEAGKPRVIACTPAGAATPDVRVVVNATLEEFRTIDRLIIEVESTYRVRKSRFQYWEMGRSTRNTSLTLIHPPHYSVVFKAFEHNPDLSRIETLPTTFHYESESWMLEGSGVAWRLEPGEVDSTLRQFVQERPLIASPCPPSDTPPVDPS